MGEPETVTAGPLPGIVIGQPLLGGAGGGLVLPLAGLPAPATSSGAGGVAGAPTPRTIPLRPGTHGLTPPRVATSPAAVVFRFVSHIPAWIWILLAATLALAAAATASAWRASRHALRQAGLVAAVEEVAMTDALTGLLNRRGFAEACSRELDRAKRYGRPLALAFVDVRGLKAVNDTEGHLAGDRLLKEVATLLKDTARAHDVVGRLGGDEMAMLLAEQSMKGAFAVGVRLSSRLPVHRKRLGLSTDWGLTIGLATHPEDGDSFEELLAAADRRLYEQRGIHLR